MVSSEHDFIGPRPNSAESGEFETRNLGTRQRNQSPSNQSEVLLDRPPPSYSAVVRDHVVDLGLLPPTLANETVDQPEPDVRSFKPPKCPVCSDSQSYFTITTNNMLYPVLLLPEDPPPASLCYASKIDFLGMRPARP